MRPVCRFLRAQCHTYNNCRIIGGRMFNLRIPTAALIGLGVLAGVGCADDEPRRERVVYVDEPPPEPRVEVVGVAPGPDYFWVDGYWYAHGRNFDWHPGHWERRRGPHEEYVPG